MSQLAAEPLLVKVSKLQHEGIPSSLGSSWLTIAQALLFGPLL